MIVVRVLALGALLLTSPAFAEGWRAETVSGDVVVIQRGDTDPLAEGAVVDEGATVVSGQQASVTLARGGDSVTLNSDTIVVLHPGSGGARAVVETKSGKVEFHSVAAAEGPLEVKTRDFRVDAGAADFTVKSRKGGATVDVSSGKVQVDDPHRNGPVTVTPGDNFRSPSPEASPKASEPGKTASNGAGAGKKAESGSAEADAAAKALESDGKTKKSKGKSSSAFAAALAKKAGGAAKDGLDSLADDYDADADTPDVPKIGLLAFLFGPEAPSTPIVLMGLGVLFLALGKLSSSVLNEAGFGMFGNALILLIGALLGAAVHDLAFSPTFFWEFEPAPGILTPTFGGLALLIGACFARRHIEDRMEQNLTAKPVARSAGIAGRGARFVR